MSSFSVATSCHRDRKPAELPEHSSIFNAHADTYAVHADRSPVNRDYDRPAIIRLAGPLRGKRVLELGCAAGALTSQLVDHGASVLGVDVEPRMVELAQKRLGDRARFAVADLASPPLGVVRPGSVDIVIASLVLHYIADWAPVLDDLVRVLIPGGAMVFSLHHPITGWLLSDQADYHRTELISETWDLDGLTVTARPYRRPLASIFTELLRAGFSIDAVEEPRPQFDTATGLSPEACRVLNTQPLFLYLRAGRA